jgi:hypothetical protein
VDGTRSAGLWKMVHSCLLWCLWRESNDRSFEDHERTPEEFESLSLFFFNLWTVVFVYPLVLCYDDFLFLAS